MSTIEELQKQIAEAAVKGDTKLVEQLAGEIVKGKAERHKGEIESQRKEAEAMAGAREKLGTAIHQAVKALNLDKSMVDLKAWGFTYKVDRANPAEADVTYKSVALSTQAVKSRSGGGNGGSGKTKSEFGLSLDEVFAQFANTEEKGKFAEAEAADLKHAQEHGLTTPKQSNRWRVKDVVKKRALSEGLLAPQK